MIGRIFIAIVICLGYSNCLDLCGDWTQYKDIKCIKVLEKKGTEEEALNTCTKLDQSSILLTIHSKDEQDYFNALLEKYHNISLNVWLGMKYSEKAFKWIDGTNTDYTNWSEDAIKDGSTQCAEMSLQKESIGKWSDVPCKKTALIACQKKQEFNLNDLKNDLDNITKFFENKFNKQDKEIESLTNDFKSMFPIGFLYTQLPNQSSPQQLWPNMNWTEVTKDYAGVFFRVHGEQAEQFGKVQEDNAPHISHVAYDGGGAICLNQIKSRSADLKEGSSIVVSGVFAGGNNVNCLKFDMTGGEVRPRNMAVRIWKKVA